jgi:putative ABC transport system permease protein
MKKASHPKSSVPPRWADRLLEWFCAPHLLEEIQGDLHERFHKRAKVWGEKEARRQYAWEVVGFLRPFVLKKSIQSINPNNTAMFQNYLKIALRNLWRHKVFSFINIFGLALSMSVCLLVIFIIKDQLSFDRFHAHLDRIYRLNTIAIRKDNSTEKYASTAFPLGSTLHNDYTVVEEIVRFNRGLNSDAVYQQTNLPLRGLFTDPSFFKVFGFQLAVGDPATALNEPNSVVLTHETANRFFGKENPLGKVLTVKGIADFKVTGVLKPIREKTHFEFEALGSNASLPALEKAGGEIPSLDDWKSIYTCYLYVLLKEGRTKQELEAVLPAIARQKYANLTLETRDKGYAFYAQPLREITPGEMLSNNMGNGLPASLLWVVSGLAFIIMLSACFNYANLSIARSLTRAREIGIRKVLGAVRSQVFAQFMSEAVLMALCALILAYFLWRAVAGGLHQVAPELQLTLKEDGVLFLLFLLFSVFTGVLAGLFPSLYLSAFKPVQVLKNLSGIKLFSRLTLRKVLIVFQFTICMVGIMVVTVIYQQTNFAMQANYGFNKENIVNINLQGLPYRNLANEIAEYSQVKKVSAISHSLGTWADRSVDVRKQPEAERIRIRDYAIDQNYLDNLGLQLVVGNNFPANASDDREQFVILNQKALQVLSLGTPSEALGKTLILDDSTEVAIIGVVKDFNFRPLTYEIGPLALRYQPGKFSQLNVKISGNELVGTLAFLESTWKKFDKVHPFHYRFFEEELQSCYRQFKVMMTVLSFFGILAVTIACLGLLGMATFATETRTKEIGIRKVLGASVSSLVLLLSRNFLYLLLIAIAMALPLGYLLGNVFLEQFAYRINIGSGTLGIGVVLVFGLGLLTIGTQTMRAARSNPVKVLRTE